MASVKQCDRCKKIINPINVSIITIWNTYSSTKTIDLCPDCVNQVRRFIEKAGEENEDTLKEGEE